VSPAFHVGTAVRNVGGSAGVHVHPPSVSIDHTRAWRIVIPFEITSGAAKGSKREVHLEVVTLLEDDTVAWVTTQDGLAEFDKEELRDKLVLAVGGRMDEPPA